MKNLLILLTALLFLSGCGKSCDYMGTLTLKPDGGSWYHILILDSDRKVFSRFGTTTAETMVCDTIPFGDYTIFVDSFDPSDSFKVKINKCQTTIKI